MDELRTVTHWIDGAPARAAADRRSVVWNPATGRAQAEVVLATGEDVNLAVASGRRAFAQWSMSSVSARQRVLFAFRELVNANAERLAKCITAEHGKVLSDARGEVQRGLEVVEFACGIGQLLKGEYSDQVSSEVDSYTFRQPIGVVAGITPFNFPVMVPMWMHPVAIACGNSFILKPSERDPSPSLILAELWRDAGLPDGVFNVVQGDREAVDALLDHPGIAAISFVGSTPIARVVHERASATHKRVQALGGAKNHAVVLPDAELDFAVEHLIAAGFGSAGERCMAISVVIAVGGVGPDLIERLGVRAATIQVGPGDDAASEMGPIVTEAARQRILEIIDAGSEEGARVAVDGRGCTVEGHEDGFFVGPTILAEVTPEMRCYRDEIFGPVLCVMEVATLDAAIALINENAYGNGTAIFTSSGDAARRFSREVEVGMVGVNVPIPVPMAYHSFGGWKDSLFGEHHVHGMEGVSFYTRAKVVTQRWPEASAPSGASYHFPTAR